MKQVYIDIIEKSLSAYTDERIRAFIDRVRENGLTEHGFPRLGANIGILLANGRAERYYPFFVEIMDLCCEQIPRVHAANDFSVRELVCALGLLEKRNMYPELIAKWKKQLASINPWGCYECISPKPVRAVGNWAMFSAVSEWVRGLWCGADTYEFVDHQISSQIIVLDENGMYKDPNCPMVYDIVPRFLMSALLLFGYDGEHKKTLENALDKSLDLTLKMQSVTGEIPYGGRSAQFYHNEALLNSLLETESVRLYRRGDEEKARAVKGAAKLCTEYLLEAFSGDEIFHIKNKFDKDSFIGSEPYGYFDKYMITAASNIGFAYYFTNDEITPTAPPAVTGGFVAETSSDFHKICVNSNGYFLEFDTKADLHYDASGLGRIHKKGCASQVCLSLPFPPKTESIKLEADNPRPMSLCVWCEDLYGSESYAEYEKVSDFPLTLNCRMKNTVVKQTYEVSESGVDISLEGEGRLGFMVPAFEFDGRDYTDIQLSCGKIEVVYNGSKCTYTWNGNVLGCETYNNRNGRYRVYRIEAKRLHIEIEDLKWDLI